MAETLYQHVQMIKSKLHMVNLQFSIDRTKRPSYMISFLEVVHDFTFQDVWKQTNLQTYIC